MSLAAGLPPLDRALLPADIRTAAPARREAYEAGLGFERLLVQQLTQSLADSASDALGGDSPYASLLPEALADGVMGGGGLGLARQLLTSLAGGSLATAGERNTTTAGEPLRTAGERDTTTAGGSLATAGERDTTSADADAPAPTTTPTGAP